MAQHAVPSAAGRTAGMKVKGPKYEECKQHIVKDIQNGRQSNGRRPFPGGEFLDKFPRIWRVLGGGGRTHIGLTSPGRQFRLMLKFSLSSVHWMRDEPTRMGSLGLAFDKAARSSKSQRRGRLPMDTSPFADNN